MGGFVLGYQMGHAYVTNERMRDLKVSISVSFCWPQLVPARARMILRRGVARLMIDEMCGVKVKGVSKITPRMRGLRSRGRGELLREMAG